MKVKRVLLFMVALTWPPFALAQQSVLLQNALDRLTTFGSLTIDGVYNLSTGVTISHSNVKLTCQPGNTSLNTAGNNVTAITVVTGLTGVEIAGCHSSGLFSNRGYTGTHAVEVQGNSEVTFTNPSFDNFYGTPIYIPGPGATIRVRGGNISNIGNGTQSDGPNGILAYNYTLLDVQNLSLLNITSGDGIKTASCNNGGCNGYAGTNVGTTYISNLRGTNIHRYCVEIGGNLQKVVDIESPVCDNTNAPWGMLGGLSLEVGATAPPNTVSALNPVSSLRITNPTLIQNLSSGGGLAMELFGSGQVVSNMNVLGPWSSALNHSGSIEVAGGQISGTTHGITTDGTYPCNEEVDVHDITLLNVQTLMLDFVCYSVKVHDVKIFRQPGYFSDDNTITNGIGIEAIPNGGVGSVKNNTFTITAPVTGIPSGFNIQAFVTQNFSSAPGHGVVFDGNTFNNINATAVGTAFGPGLNFPGSQILNSKIINPAFATPALNCATLDYFTNNLPYKGNGSVLPASCLFPVLPLAPTVSSNGARVATSSFTSPSGNTAGVFNFTVSGGAVTNQVIANVTFNTPLSSANTVCFTQGYAGSLVSGTLVGGTTLVATSTTVGHFFVSSLGSFADASTGTISYYCSNVQ
jgi:hypothetical protein